MYCCLDLAPVTSIDNACLADLHSRANGTGIVTDYGLLLAWIGLAVGLIDALAEWLGLPKLLIAMLARHGERGNVGT